jgi:mercuric ion transport protein
MRNSGAPSDQRAGSLIAFAVLASILASTCCVLPLVLVLVGITGAWMVHLTALKPLAPYAIALTFGALGWAGWLVFRPVAMCTVEDQACATARPAMRKIFFTCAVFIALLLGFPLIAPLFY